MSFWVSKTPYSSALSVKAETNNGGSFPEEEDHQDDSQVLNQAVSSHICIKPTHSSTSAAGTLDREVVLRRIQQRKRANKVKDVAGGLFRLPFSSKPDKIINKDSVKWVDDAFAAP